MGTRRREIAAGLGDDAASLCVNDKRSAGQVVRGPGGEIAARPQSSNPHFADFPRYPTSTLAPNWLHFTAPDVLAKRANSAKVRTVVCLSGEARLLRGVSVRCSMIYSSQRVSMRGAQR